MGTAACFGVAAYACGWWARHKAHQGCRSGGLVGPCQLSGAAGSAPCFARGCFLGCVVLPEPLNGHQAYPCHDAACLCIQGQSAHAVGSLCHRSEGVAISALAGLIEVFALQEMEDLVRRNLAAVLSGCIFP